MQNTALQLFALFSTSFIKADVTGLPLSRNYIKNKNIDKGTEFAYNYVIQNNNR
jgi:hypothetical protein